MPGPQFLAVEQVLLTTLVVKLAVMAALATMLVALPAVPAHPDLRAARLARPPDLRRSFFGIPLAAGVVARLLLNYKAADLTLEGAFLAGLIAGPYAGAIVGAMVGLPPLVNGEIIALPFAVGCGFAGGGLRELCPKEAIWHFSPFVFTSLHRRAWQMIRAPAGRLAGGAAARAGRPRAAAPGARRALERAPPPVLPAAEPARCGRCASSCSRRCSSVATPIKIWNNARIEHRLAGAGEAAARGEDRGARQPDQPALPVQHARVDLVAHPHPARHRADADHQAVGPAAPADAQHRSLRHAARGAGIDRRVPRHRGGPLRPAAAGRQARSARTRSTSSCRA